MRIRILLLFSYSSSSSINIKICLILHLVFFPYQFVNMVSEQIWVIQSSSSSSLVDIEFQCLSSKKSSNLHQEFRSCIIIKQYWIFAIWDGGMSWNQDLRCTFQEANPSPIHLFKILLPKFIHRVVFHYITQIIISDFKDFRMKYLEDKSPILLLFMQFNPSFKSRSINKDCSRSAPNPKNSSLLWRSLLPLSLFVVAIPIQRNHCFTFSWKIWMR